MISLYMIGVISVASRMEKYNKENNSTTSRTARNASLYSEIYDNAQYTNVEGIASIEKSNEIDITKIKRMIKEREEQRHDENVIVKKIVLTKTEEDLDTDMTNYDLKELISEAKKKRSKNELDRYGDDKNYKILNEKIKQFNDEDLKMEDLTDIQSLSKLEDKDLSLDLLDSLKSDDNTFIGELDNRKNLEDTKEMDDTFYTSSMHFNKEDFEELDNINKNLKKNTFWITVLVFIILVIVITGCLFLFDNIL